MKWWLIGLWMINAWAAHDPYRHLESPKVSDRKAVQRGAQYFKARCASCHAIAYAAYDPIVKAAGYRLDQMPKHPPGSWNGRPPPDLSLTARVHSPAWLYTYLRTYYVDTQQPSGFNNLIMPQTSMPNPWADLQGRQVLVADVTDKRVPWYRWLALQEVGTLSPDAFDQYVSDVVAFLTYIGEPVKQERESIGVYVMLYLVLLSILTGCLYRSYWRKKP